MSHKEKDLYQPVIAALDRSFSSINKDTFIETAATKGLGESFKALIPRGREIAFRFSNLQPDIVGYVKHSRGNDLFTVEVKRGSPTPRDIYQAKMYKELYGATFGFLIVTAPITVEIKRLVASIPIILMSAGDHTFNFLAIGCFDPNTREFTDWLTGPFIHIAPFNHLRRLSF
jgi:hypothetical protein